ncbi:recombinase RecT [Tepidibacillus marianensis]|uniref:recombinase RecT n=1 Tax=Tepidibacillus marianensis TaxID=3131995 RepID=UPI0030D0C212
MSNQLEKQEHSISASERFTNKIVAEFSGGVGEVALTDFQKRLVQNYFMGIDSALRAAEDKRAKKKSNQDPLPVTWASVNMEQLARDVVAAARIGLDPAQKNHINMIPFKNNNTNKYDIAFVEGYRGIELKATKYGLDVPNTIVVELVYSNDTFKPIKKDFNNRVESYTFEVGNPFDRGEVVGGFYYHVFNDNQSKNKLVTMSLKEILKRKPAYASPEFWGGEKDKWENGKKVGKEQVEGWFEKMVYKTIYRAAYGDITIDSQKIDDDYLRLKQMEHSYAEVELEKDLSENANREVIDIESVVVNEPGESEQNQMDGPGF